MVREHKIPDTKEFFSKVEPVLDPYVYTRLGIHFASRRIDRNTRVALFKV